MYCRSVIARLVGNGTTFPRQRTRLMAGMVVLAAVAGSLLLGASPARAADIYWSSTAATTDWTTGTNWVGNIAPANSLTADIAHFNSAAYLNQPNMPDRSINGLVFGDGTTVTAPLTINQGGTLTIGASGITMNANAGPASVNFVTQLGASQTWTNNSVNALTMPTMIFNSGSSPVTLTLAGSGSGGFTFQNGWGGLGLVDTSGSGSPNPASRTALVVNMTGSGVVNFGTANAVPNMGFSGGLTVQAGTVVTLNNLGSGQITLGDASANANNVSLIVAVNNNSANTIANAINLESGTTGTITIGAGNNIAGNNAPITATFSGPITGSHDLSIGAANAQGTVVLGGVSSIFTGNVTVNAGNLKLTGSTGGGALTMAGGSSTFNYAPVGANSQTLGALTFAKGDVTVQSTNDGTSAALTFASAARTSGATGNFVLSGAGTSSIALTGQAPGFIDAGVFFAGGTTAATYAYYDTTTTPGTPFVRGINYTTPDPNTVNVTVAGTIGTVNSFAPFSNVQVGNVAISAQPTAQISTLQLGTGNFGLDSGTTLTVNGILKAGNTAGGTISGGAGLTPASGADLVVRTDMATDALTISSPILANGANALVKSGAGQLRVTGTNNLTGGLFINGGTFTPSSDASMGAPGVGITLNGGALDFASGYSGGYTISRPITVAVGGGTLETEAYWNLPTITVNSNITGTGLLVVNADGWRAAMTVFAGDNSGFSGGIKQTGYDDNQVPARNGFEFHGANSTGTGPVTLVYSASLRLRGDANTTFLSSNVICGAGNTYVTVDPITTGTSHTLTLKQLTLNGGTFNVTSANNYKLGITTLNVPAYTSTTLNPATSNIVIAKITGDIGFYSGSPALTLAGTATGNTIGSINLAGTFNSSSTPAVTVSSGTWTITGPGSYVTPTNVSGGTLVLANTIGSATGKGNVTLNGGTLASSVGTGGIMTGNVLAGTAAHSISPGGDGLIGSLAVGGLTLNSNSTLRFDVTNSSTLDQIIASGALSVSGGPATILVPTLSPGSYKLMGFGSTTALPLSFNLNFITGGATPSAYSLKITGTELDVLVAAPSNNTTLALMGNSVSIRTMQGQIASASVNLRETSGTNSADFITSSGSAVTVAPTAGTVASSGTQVLTLGLADYSTVGAHTGTVAVTNNSNSADPFNTSGNQIAVTGAVVANRTVTSSSVTGGIHAGLGILPAAAPFTLGTTGDDNSNTRVTVSNIATPDGNGFTTSGGINPTFNAATVTDARFLNGPSTLTLGSVYNGTLTLTTNQEGLTGEIPINVTVPYNVTVFSGNANWVDQNGGSNWDIPKVWGTDTNWTDASSSATLGAPGLAGAVSVNDQANFIGNGYRWAVSSGQVNLNNASPHLAAVNFNGVALPDPSNPGQFLTDGIYTIGQGTGTGKLHLTAGGTIQVGAAGTSRWINSVNVPVVLDGTTASFVDNSTTGGRLAIGGPVSGSTGATVLTLGGTFAETYAANYVSGNISDGTATSLAIYKADAGVWMLSGNNTYSGGTTVNNGMLILNGGGTFSGGITVNTGGVLVVNTSDANLGAANNGITLNGGVIRFAADPNFATPITVGAGHSIAVTAAGSQLRTYVSLTTIAGNITGTDLLKITGNYGYGAANLRLSGDNSGFTGGITLGNSSTVEFDGLKSTASAAVKFDWSDNGATVKLRNDDSGAFLTSQVDVPGGPSMNINVGPLTSSVTGKTLTLNLLNVPYDYINTTFNVTGSNAYNLGVGTLNVSGAAMTINPTTASVAVTTMNLGYLGWNNKLTLGGTATGNTIGSILSTGASGGDTPFSNAVTVTGGTWTLTGASTYTVPTVVNGGTLRVNGSLAAGSAVTVNNGGTLDGIGTINGAATVLNGGMLARTAPGTLNVGSLDLQLGSKSTLDFSALSASTPSVSVTGSLILTDTVFSLSGIAPTVSSTYNLFGYGTLTSTFDLALLSVDNYAAFGFTGYSFQDDSGSKLVKLTLTRSGIGAGSGTWTGAAVPADNLWTNTANWSGGYPSAATHTATFGGAGQVAAIDLNGSKTVGKVELSSTSAGTGYTLGLASTPNTLTLDNGPSTAAEIKAVSGTHFINAKVFGTASQTLNVIAETGGSLALTGGANNPATATLALSQSSTGTLAAGSVANAGTMTVSGTVAANAISGAGSTTVSGSLTADSIVQNTLSIGAGGVVTIRETTGGAVNAVPEPGTWVLIVTALMGLLALRRRNRG